MTKIYMTCSKCKKLIQIKSIHITDFGDVKLFTKRKCRKCHKGEEN